MAKDGAGKKDWVREFESRAAQTVREYHLFAPGQRILAGVSGGADSMALLTYLLRVREDLGLEIGAAHIHHGIRGEEADGDAAFVAAFCQSRDIPFYQGRIDVPALAAAQGTSLETAGREGRHRALKALMEEQGYHKIALAHHLDDQAETLIMHLVRGSGLRGAAAMAPASGVLVRPFLALSREEIENYLSALDIPHREDATNGDLNYTRNRVRHTVMPALAACNAGAARHLAAFARTAADYDRFFEDLTAREAARCLSRRDGAVVLDLTDFGEKDPLIQRALIREAIRTCDGSLVDIEGRHVEAVTDKLEAGITTWNLDLPRGLSVRRRYGELLVDHGLGTVPFGGCYPVARNGSFYCAREGLAIHCSLESGQGLKKTQKTKNSSEIILDYGKIRNSLLLRNRRDGDYIVLKDNRGRKKLKKFFIDRKIDRDQRNALPLLAVHSEIIWIPGSFFNGYYAADQNTEKILRIGLEKF